MGADHFWADPWNSSKIVLILISVAESTIAFLPLLWNRTIISRVIRPFFFVGLSSRLRMSMSAIGRSLHPIGEVLLLIVSLILLFAWASMLLFEDWSCRHHQTSPVFTESMPCFLRQVHEQSPADHPLLTT